MNSNTEFSKRNRVFFYFLCSQVRNGADFGGGRCQRADAVQQHVRTGGQPRVRVAQLALRARGRQHVRPVGRGRVLRVDSGRASNAVGTPHARQRVPATVQSGRRRRRHRNAVAGDSPVTGGRDRDRGDRQSVRRPVRLRRPVAAVRGRHRQQ